MTADCQLRTAAALGFIVDGRVWQCNEGTLRANLGARVSTMYDGTADPPIFTIRLSDRVLVMRRWVELSPGTWIGAHEQEACFAFG
jgi:hypothetical protein